jgi:hypothetical protein
MRHTRLRLCAVLVSLWAQAGVLYSAPLATAFTYQGRVRLSGSPLNATDNQRSIP